MDENYLDSRLELIEIKNNYNLAVHKTDTTQIALVAVLTAIAAAVYSSVDLILGCACNLHVNSCVLLTFKIFNFIVIACTLVYNVALPCVQSRIKKFNAKKDNVNTNTPIQRQIDHYKQKIQDEQNRLKRIKLWYTIAYCTIAVIEMLLLILAFTIKS